MTAATERIVAAGTKPRRWGSLYVAEHKILAMRAYLQTLVVTILGNPLLYLFGLGVGLAHLINAPVDGATYLQFVAPALLASAAVTVSANEFTYPVIAGFKWNAIYFGMNAAPVSPTQIVNGTVLAVLVRMLPTVGVYFVFMLLFGAVPSGFGVISILTAVLTGYQSGRSSWRRCRGSKMTAASLLFSNASALCPCSCSLARFSRSRICPSTSSGSDGFRRSGMAHSWDAISVTVCRNRPGLSRSMWSTSSSSPLWAGDCAFEPLLDG
jgi:hypothetical protein